MRADKPRLMAYMYISHVANSSIYRKYFDRHIPWVNPLVHK